MALGKAIWIGGSGVIGVICGALVTGLIGFVSNERQLDVKFVEIGVNILRAPASDDASVTREWAIDLIEKKSGTKFTGEQRNALLRKPLNIVEMNDQYEAASEKFRQQILRYHELLKRHEEMTKKYWQTLNGKSDPAEKMGVQGRDRSVDYE